jgi:hypothetical protein
VLRERIDAHSQLGPGVKMIIKRGCTNYERACGPSDRYSFHPLLDEIEAFFRKRFRRPSPGRSISRRMADEITMLKLVKTAYSVGDETYKDFTGGKDVLPQTVDYSPEP